MIKRILILSTASLLLATSLALAQGFPARHVTMVVPFAPAGPSDVVARLLSEAMRSALGQPVVVENAAGAGGSIGMGRVARAAPDGYTVGLGAWNTGVVNGAMYNLSYDVVNDFEPVILLPATPLFIGTKAAVPAKDLRELVAWLKVNQDHASIGTSGIGTSPHVAAVMFQNLAGSNAQIVHYKGGAPALQDLLGGQIDIVINQTTLFLPHLAAGKVKVFAVLDKNRLAQAPDVPTVDEAGMPGFYLSSWNGLWAPKGTPRDVVAKLNAAVVAALNNPELRRKFSDLGQVIPPPEQLTSAFFGSYHKAEYDKWLPVIKAAGIKPQ
ncbi:MAG: tripartite tricarboxylate transporter substrate-binding protein [Betaproteobacteria bacterium]